MSLERYDTTIDDLLPPNENIPHLASAWDFYNSTLRKAKFFAAPMVNQSELPYRMLVRKYNCHVAVTPMIHSRIFQESKKYRKSAFSTCAADRPLIVQFCGNDPDILLRAAKYVENDCDAVDLNLGCPQGIARKGHYGAFLLTETELLCNIVSKLHKNLSVPVTCKIRLLPTMSDTIKLCLALERAGCSLLTVHGRTKENKQQKTGNCNWKAIGIIKKYVQIPVVSNGGIKDIKDVYACLKETCADGADVFRSVTGKPIIICSGIMHRTKWGGFRKQASVKYSNSVIETISLPLHERQIQLAYEYMDLVEKYPTQKSPVRAHLNKFLYSSFVAFASHPTIISARKLLNLPKKKTEWFGEYKSVIDAVKSVVMETKLKSSGSSAGGLNSPKQKESSIDCSPGKWYMRHRDLKRKHKELEKNDCKPVEAPFSLFEFQRQNCKRGPFIYGLCNDRYGRSCYT